MEARVARLEGDLKDIKDGLKALTEAVTALRVDVAEVKGRVASLPTIMQIIGLVFLILGGTLGGTFAILRYGLPKLGG